MWTCLGSIDGVGHAIEIGEGVLLEDLLDDPPNRGSIRHMVMETTRHARVKHGKRFAVAGEDKRARVAMVREISRSLETMSLRVVVNDNFTRLNPKLVAGVRVHAATTSQGEIGGTAVLGEDDNWFSGFVFCLRVDDGATWGDTGDRKLQVSRDGTALALDVDRPKQVLEFRRLELIA